MTLAVLIATAIAFYAAILVGEWLRSGKRELFDEPLRDRADGDWPFVPPINRPRAD